MLMILLTFMLTSCQKNSSLGSRLPFSPSEIKPKNENKTENQVPTLNQKEGGISGGGGGTLPSNPISIYEVKKIVQNSKKDLRLLLNFYDHGKLKNDSFIYNEAVYKKIFQGDKTIRDLLETIDIELRETEACYDSENNPVDASIFSKLQNAICLSSFRVAPKLTADNARNEIEALLLHELSHLLGTTEDEAVWLQIRTISDIREADDHSIDQFLRDKLKILEDIQSSFRTVLTSKNFDELEEKLLSSQLLSLNTWTSFYDLEKRRALLTHDEIYYLSALHMKLAYFSQYASCKKSNPESYWCEVLEKTFNGKNEITIEEFVQRQSENPYFKFLTLKKALSLNEVLNTIDEIRTFYKSQIQFDRLNGIEINGVFKQIIPDFLNHQNPFKTFSGKYDSVSNNCKDHDFFYGIEIFEDKDRLYLKKYFDNGSSTNDLMSDTFHSGDLTIYNNSQSINSNDERTAIHEIIYGDLWGNINGTVTWKLKRLSFTLLKNGHFLLKQMIREKSGLINEPRYYSQDCEVEMIKK